MLNPLPYRALALDLDGTLLNPAGRLTVPTIAVLRRLSAAGLNILLASGRMSSRVFHFADALDLPISLVTYNGAVIHEGGPGNWKRVSTRGLPASARDTIFGLCRDQGVHLNVYAHGQVHAFHPAGDFTWCNHYEFHSGAKYASKLACLEDLPSEGLEKLLAISSPAKRERLYTSWSPLLSELCDLTKSNPEYLEFTGKGVSKGTALSLWLDRQGIQASELLAFGDAENDREMLALAGLGIGMANSTPGLRATHGRFSRWSHSEDGVARELCDLFGIEFASLPSEP